MNSQLDSATPDAGAINQRVKAAVHAHRVKLRVLTTAAFVFGFVPAQQNLWVDSGSGSRPNV